MSKKVYVDLLFESILKHDWKLLPLAARYSATENGVPAAVGNMTSWRTITGINAMGQVIVDEKKQQIIATADVDEGGTSSAFVGRMKIDNEKICELEILLIRSRAQAGFWFAPQDIGKAPDNWTRPISGKKASYEELYELGKAIWDPTSTVYYESTPDCLMMEDGGIVYEHVEYAAAIMPVDASIFPPDVTRVAMPVGLHPGRPADSNARILAIDEEQGIVATIGMVHGYVSPYIVSDETSSCFVPEPLIAAHRGTLREELFIDNCAMNEMKVSAFCLVMARLDDGKLCGYHQYTSLHAPGGDSVWPVD